METENKDAYTKCTRMQVFCFLFFFLSLLYGCDDSSFQAAVFAECIVLGCVVFSVWIKVTAMGGWRAGASELSNVSSISAGVSAAFKINTSTCTTQQAVRESRGQLYKPYTNAAHVQKDK